MIPLGWAGDKYDKRAILLGSIAVCVLAYALFAFVATSGQFIGVRVVQGIGVVGVGLLSLAMVGELAGGDERANTIGKFNAWKLAAGILGTLGAGVLFDRYGFDVVFGVLVVLFVVALVGTWLSTESDDSTVEFAFDDLAFNRRILTITSFRSQYAFAVTMVRNWVPIYVGVSAAQGGLGLAATAVAIVLATERFTNMLFQPYTGRLADGWGRARFVFAGGICYGVLALGFPSAALVGETLGLATTVPHLGELPAAFFVAIGLNALLGIADAFREPASMALFADEGTDQGGVTSSFGIRDIVWRPGSVLAPMIGGVVMEWYGIEWVFYVAGAFAISGALVFLTILWRDHGREALTEW